MNLKEALDIIDSPTTRNDHRVCAKEIIIAEFERLDAELTAKDAALDKLVRYTSILCSACPILIGCKRQKPAECYQAIKNWAEGK